MADPTALGHVLEGVVERDPLTGQYQLLVVDLKGKPSVQSLQELLAPYEGKEVRLTLASFENLSRLAKMVEDQGGGGVHGVLMDDLPGVSFDIRKG